MKLNIPTLFICIERALFIFAITLPFDIRDLSVDQSASLKTIPAVIGIKRTKIIAAISIFLMISLCSLLFKMDFYNRSYLTALFISAIISYILIYFSKKGKHDYYYTGLLDGMMLLQFLLIELFILLG